MPAGIRPLVDTIPCLQDTTEAHEYHDARRQSDLETTSTFRVTNRAIVNEKCVTVFGLRINRYLYFYLASIHLGCWMGWTETKLKGPEIIPIKKKPRTVGSIQGYIIMRARFGSAGNANLAAPKWLRAVDLCLSFGCAWARDV